MVPKFFLSAVLLVLASAQDYSVDDQGARAQQLAPNYAHPDYHHQDYHHHHNLYEDAKAEPYDFGFQSTDEYGTIMNRQEASDNTGAVRGSYGYTDPHGVFRHVDYVADEFGFRAQVKSNEPGMGSQSPANVEIYAEAPPAGVVIERPYLPYHPHPQASQAQQSQVAPQRRNPAGAGQQGGAVRQARPSSQARPSAQAGSRHPAQTSGGAAGFGAGSASTSSSSYNSDSRHVHAAAAPFNFVPQRHNPYPSSASSEPTIRYPYVPRSNYGQHAAIQYGPQSAAAAATSAVSSTTTTQQQTSASSSSANAAGYRHHLSNLAPEGDKVEGGSSIILPTVVTNGVPTLVKHIHAYPAA